MAAGPDGNVWYIAGSNSDAGSFILGKISPEGAAQEFRVPPPYETETSISDLTAGPDGNVWYTRSGGGPPPPFPGWNALVGRVTPTGEFAEFTVGSPRRLGGIAAGSDGALWFADPEQNRIGRVTTAGAITYFAGLSAGFNPTGVTRGVDGNIWFWTAGQHPSHRVGRIAPDGGVREFDLGAGHGASGITAGPDGTMWMTGDFGNFKVDDIRELARLTPDGDLSDVFFPVAYGPQSPVTGSDGNVWVGQTPQGGYLPKSPVARVTPDGDYTAFCGSGMPGDSPSITAGPDGAIWGVGGESSGGGVRIFRITTDTPADPDCQPRGAHYVVGVYAPKRQNVARTAAVKVHAACNSACASVTGSGRINSRRRRFHGRQIATAAWSARLRRATHGRTAREITLRLRIPAAALKRLRRDLAQGAKATARITVTARSQTGKRLGTETTTVALVSKR